MLFRSALKQIGGEAAAHADLVVTGSRVVVVWKEFDGERTHLRAMVSDNGGDSWRDSTLAMTEAASDQPRALLIGNRVTAFWNTQREGRRVLEIAP